MAPKEKVLYYFYHESVPGEVWVDESGDMVAVVHENDGTWRKSLDFVAKHFGGRVVELNGYDILGSSDDESLTSEDLGKLDFVEIVELTAKRNKKAILRAIRHHNE